jgi:hypothetical protein
LTTGFVVLQAAGRTLRDHVFSLKSNVDHNSAVERAINRMKVWRVIATRYDKSSGS